MTPTDLSRQVREYYRRYFARRRDDQEAFERALAAVWPDVLEATAHGGDAGFLLHVLVCTRFRRVAPNVAQSATLRGLTRNQRAALIRGLRAFVALGEAGVQEIFGAAEEWARLVWSGNQFLYQQLNAFSIETPAFGMGSRVNPTGRHARRPLTACIVCLLDELQAHPKPVEATTVLLAKFSVLPPSRADIAAIEFVKKRAQRARKEVSDPHHEVGRWVELFRASYAWLRESLQAPALLDDPRPLAVREFEGYTQQEQPGIQRPGLSDRDHGRDG